MDSNYNIYDMWQKAYSTTTTNSGVQRSDANLGENQADDCSFSQNREQQHQDWLTREYDDVTPGQSSSTTNEWTSSQVECEYRGSSMNSVDEKKDFSSSYAKGPDATQRAVMEGDQKMFKHQPVSKNSITRGWTRRFFDTPNHQPTSGMSSELGSEQERHNTSDSRSNAKRPLEVAKASSAKKMKPDDTSPSQAWPESAHRMFVEAIFEIGLKGATPAVILENMTEKNAELLTSERVKSHLQKYRSNKEKSKEEFMDEYDIWIHKALTVGAAAPGSNLLSPSSLVEIMGTSEILGGDAAAFLAYSAMAEEADRRNISGIQAGTLSGMCWTGSLRNMSKLVKGAKIPFPVLSEEERKSPLGVSISHLVGLLHSMTQYVTEERVSRMGSNRVEDSKHPGASVPVVNHGSVSGL